MADISGAYKDFFVDIRHPDKDFPILIPSKEFIKYSHLIHENLLTENDTYLNIHL